MVKYSGINHLAMATGDMDGTIRFWRDLLGMRLIAGVGERPYKLYFFEISPNDTIAFFEWEGTRPLELKDHGLPVKGPFGFDHVAIGVESDADLLELRGKLEAAGFWASEIMDHGFIHSIYAFDPNNIPIEFSAPVEGQDLRKTPRMKDRFPSAVAKEGPDPVPGHWPDHKDKMKHLDRTVYPGEGLILATLPEDGED